MLGSQGLNVENDFMGTTSGMEKYTRFLSSRATGAHSYESVHAVSFSTEWGSSTRLDLVLP